MGFEVKDVGIVPLNFNYLCTIVTYVFNSVVLSKQFSSPETIIIHNLLFTHLSFRISLCIKDQSFPREIFYMGKFSFSQETNRILGLSVVLQTQLQQQPHLTISQLSLSDLISRQHWSELKTHLNVKATSPTTLLHHLLSSETDPELTLRYFNWYQKEFKLSHPLELTFRLLHSLANAKKYSKMRSL
jgi:hypothetical protein